MNSNWRRLSPINYQQSTVDVGSSMTVRSSLYEIPKAVRSGYDPKKRRYEIEFRYLDSGESTRLVRGANDVWVFVGSNSRRIFRLSLPGEKTRVSSRGEIDATIAEALNTLAPGVDARSNDNYAAAESIISDQRGALFEPA
jgi:hypothetical protein